MDSTAMLERTQRIPYVFFQARRRTNSKETKKHKENKRLQPISNDARSPYRLAGTPPPGLARSPTFLSDCALSIAPPPPPPPVFRP